MHFCTERGWWILSHITYIESALNGSFNGRYRQGERIQQAEPVLVLTLVLFQDRCEEQWTYLSSSSIMSVCNCHPIKTEHETWLNQWKWLDGCLWISLSIFFQNQSVVLVHARAFVSKVLLLVYFSMLLRQDKILEPHLVSVFPRNDLWLNMKNCKIVTKAIELAWPHAW